jgi:hypothetical protein
MRQYIKLSGKVLNMEEEDLSRLLDLLFRFRESFLSSLTTSERHAIAKTILASESRLESLRSEEMVSSEERLRW